MVIPSFNQSTYCFYVLPLSSAIIIRPQLSQSLSLSFKNSNLRIIRKTNKRAPPSEGSNCKIRTIFNALRYIIIMTGQCYGDDKTAVYILLSCNEYCARQTVIASCMSVLYRINLVCYCESVRRLFWCFSRVLVVIIDVNVEMLGLLLLGTDE